MKFLEKYKKQISIYNEADEVEQDAAAPDATAAQEPNTPEAPAPVAPEGYVDLVRLLAKALAMNFPAGALDEIFRTDITAENAFPMQTALEAAIKQNEMHADNPERLQNTHFQQFSNSINAGNFINKYKHLLSSMKKQDPYIKG